MPTYCYRKPSGEVVDSIHPMSDTPKQIKVDGVVAVRDLSAERPGVIGTSKVHRCPNSHLGVHPSQVDEVNALYKRRGCKPADHDRFGDPIPDDEAHANKMTEVRGMYHQHAGYTGVTPGLANVVKDNV